MAIIGGSCRFGLWYVHVWWSGDGVHRVRFSTTGIPGTVPAPILQYCAGMPIDLTRMHSIALDNDSPAANIYRAVQDIRYGDTATYGAIAERVGTAPRAVGRAMAHNPTPLVIPCHRVVAARGIGGFTPSVAIKEALLAMEKKGKTKVQR